jgi:hypothetical protein
MDRREKHSIGPYGRHRKLGEYVAREIIKAEHIVDYTPTEGFAERLAKRFGGVVAETLISSGIGWCWRDARSVTPNHATGKLLACPGDSVTEGANL